MTDVVGNDNAGRLRRTERPRLEIDVERYAALLDDPSLSEAQKEEFLRALWQIIVSFVELGFGVHPVQLARESFSDAVDDVE